MSSTKTQTDNTKSYATQPSYTANTQPSYTANTQPSYTANTQPSYTANTQPSYTANNSLVTLPCSKQTKFIQIQ